MEIRAAIRLPQLQNIDLNIDCGSAAGWIIGYRGCCTKRERASDFQQQPQTFPHQKPSLE
jgi:hypothetical protein